MTLTCNVVTFPADIGFTHYRRVEDDATGKLAILILCDMAMADPNPMAGLDACLCDIRAETEGLIIALNS